MAEQELITQKYLQEQQRPEVVETKRKADSANKINKIISLFMFLVVAGFGGTWLVMNREAIQKATSRENVAKNSVNWMLKASGRSTTADDLVKQARAKRRRANEDMKFRVERRLKSMNY